jgi:holo-[acyl-carrier protein] synthase
VADGAAVAGEAGGPGESGGAGAGGAVVGLGIDAVEVERFAVALRRWPAMVERLFTDGERSYAAGLVNPAPSLAARFAAKEAVMKALGVGLGAFAWHDVEVVRQPSGRPQLIVRGRAASLAAECSVGRWLVSLTHTASVASAVVAGLAPGRFA